MGLPTEYDPDQTFSLTTAGELLGCSTDTVRRMIARGDLKAVRVGKRLIRIRRRDLDRALRPVTRVDLVSARSLEPDADCGVRRYGSAQSGSRSA
ncbi:excisionase family DNA-binding protein [Demequina salsinemoris]|uniref:excisionase family DNA-binding protein n=1 Tax=Demequina salsinemoris TaxID=577470 RepID=UPI0009FBD2F3|nr:excisionase family DNA-binding protein [Demequina salsinemoris]